MGKGSYLIIIIGGKHEKGIKHTIGGHIHDFRENAL
jgi:hypothetical protein